MPRTDALLRADAHARVRPLSETAAAALNSFAPHPNPHRAAARRQQVAQDEDKDDQDMSDDDMPSLYESSDRDSEPEDFEEEARRFIQYQLSAVPESASSSSTRPAAISASSFYNNSASRPPRSVDPAVHPQFRTKTVCELFCAHCEALLCRRGMSAILLGDTSVNLYSTDAKPDDVGYVGESYTTSSCDCLIHDAACHCCGNTVAYNVKQPCAKCLRSTHNGHLWIFNSDSVRARERLDRTGSRLLRWASLPPAEKDDQKAEYTPSTPHHAAVSKVSGGLGRNGSSKGHLVEVFVNR